jgi:hypothetical protein
MSAQWHYIKDREQVGPVTEERLEELAVSKRLLPNDQVRREGTSGWTSAGNALPALFPQESSPGWLGIVPKVLEKILDEKWREILGDAGKAWRASSTLKKSLVVLTVLVVLAVTVWLWIARATSPGEELGLWSRLWDGSLIVSLGGWVLKKLVEVAQVNEKVPPPISADDGSEVLGLSGRQWLVLLVAFFIPTLLVSLISSFLVGSQVHLWLTGPMLCLSGMAISVLCVQLAKAENQGILAGWGMVGVTAVLVYALTCINTRWVLLFYTLAVIVPALHLFTLAHRGAASITVKAPLMAAFGVIGLVIFLGITALPRQDGEKDESAKLVGTWLQTGGGSAFRQPTLTFTTGGTVTWGQEGDSEWVAKFKFNGKTLTIYEDRSFGNKTEYHLDLVSDSEMLLGQANERSPFGGFSVLKGRWQKGAAPEGGKKKNGDLGGDGLPPPPPQMKDLDVKLAPKAPDDPGVARIDDKRLIGKWEIVEGEQKGTATFTEGGTVLFAWLHRDLKRNLTETGNYTLNGKSLKIKASGEYGGESVRKIEFLSDDELLVQRPKGVNFSWLYGRLKRVK